MAKEKFRNSSEDFDLQSESSLEGNKIGEVASEIANKAQGVADNLSGSASDITRKAKEFASDLGSKTKEVTSQAAEKARELVKEYPLGVFFVGLGLGMVVGLGVSHSMKKAA